MSDRVEMTPEQRWRHLRENGPKVAVDLSSHELIGDKPAWFDEARFAQAKDVIEKYYIGVVYSSLTGLLLILQLPDGLEPLLVTGNSKDIPSLFKRYLSTIVHVNSWYEDDIFDPETRGYKSIRQVRSMHKRVQQLMNERHQVKDLHGKPHLWMTQYDVALTQFAFIGLAMLFPHKSAMIAASNEELELVNYYWRVLGYLMGMSDEFNACQLDKYEDVREFNRLLFEHEFKAKFREQPCAKGLAMTKSICVALQYYTPLVTFNSLAHWWSDCFSFNGYELEPMSLKDRTLVFWTRVSFTKFLRNESFLRFSSKLHRRRFAQRLEKRDKVYEQLRSQHANNSAHTYYSDRVDYFAKSSPEAVAVVAAAPAPTADASPDANNNNSEARAPAPKQPRSSLAATTFKGCPLGYDAILPALATETSAPA